MESTIALSFDALRTAIADFLGYGRTSSDWTTKATAHINEALDDGLRQFYHPPIIGKLQRSYVWSFLRPVGTLLTASSQSLYDLPEEFGGIDGDLIYSTNTLYRTIRVVGEGQIRDLQSGNSTTGVPQYAAVRPKAQDGEGSQRFEILFWPTPDAVYTLSYRYVAVPTGIASNRPFPLGGEAHSDTIKQSCLAAAEFLRDDTRGIHYQRFMEMLMASVSRDTQLTERNFYGYNGNGFGSDRNYMRRCVNTITPPTT